MAACEHELLTSHSNDDLNEMTNSHTIASAATATTATTTAATADSHEELSTSPSVVGGSLCLTDTGRVNSTSSTTILVLCVTVLKCMKILGACSDNRLRVWDECGHVVYCCSLEVNPEEEEVPEIAVKSVQATDSDRVTATAGSRAAGSIITFLHLSTSEDYIVGR